MDAKVVKMRERRAAYLQKADDARVAAAKLEKTIKTRENEAISNLVRGLANKFDGGMDEIYAMLQNMKGEESPPENAPETAKTELSQAKETEDKSIENENE